jgi:CheY-like chemotaxis protein
MTSTEQAIKQLRILAVDDEESNLLLLHRILERDGYTRVHVTTDPSRVPGMFVDLEPDLLEVVRERWWVIQELGQQALADDGGAECEEGAV